MNLLLKTNLKRLRKWNFSLTELLVVIAILAVLLSLLSPALRQVLKTSSSMVCKKNLSGIATWGMIYAEDNDEVLPTSKSGYPELSNTHWYRKNDQWVGYSTEGTPLHCPDAAIIQPRWRWWERCDFDYSVNNYLGGRKFNNGASPALPKVELLTSVKFWFADGNFSYSGLGGFYTVNGMPGNGSWMWAQTIGGLDNPGFNQGHPGNTSNFVFGDGHLESLFQYEANERMAWPKVNGIRPFTGDGSNWGYSSP